MYTGPLFIVGVSRSGTKLLRDLLNNNENVFLTDSETHFIPYFLRYLGDKNFKSIIELKKSFYSELVKTSFYLRKSKDGIELSFKEFDRITQNSQNLQSLIEIVLKYYSVKPEYNINCSQNIIWGDKTPSYLYEIELLKKYFPQAKFIHMIRDPRDVSLSFQKSWGKNLFSSAHKWNTSLNITNSKIPKLVNDYLEIKYENLTANPISEMKSVCNFIGINFESSMLNIKKTSERFGDAKNSNYILSKNSKKYLNKLSIKQITKIENICYNSMINKGYEPLYANEQQKLSFLEIIYLRGYDFIKYSYHIFFKELNLLSGMIFMYRVLRLKIVDGK